MKSKICFSLLTTIFLSLGLSLQASANLTGGVRLSSDYIWRGISFSNHKPVLQGGMDYTADSFNFGIWTITSQGYGSSSPEAEDGIENDFYGKYSIPLGGDWSIHAGFIYFYYPHNRLTRYGRSYVGLKWRNFIFEAGGVDYEATDFLSGSDSSDYRLMFSLGSFKFLLIDEEDFFLKGSHYNYYQVQTELYPPGSWGFPEDFCLGVSLGYTKNADEEKAKETSYYNLLLSLNRKIDDITASIFVNQTDRRNPITDEKMPDNTLGFSFGKNF